MPWDLKTFLYTLSTLYHTLCYYAKKCAWYPPENSTDSGLGSNHKTLHTIRIIHDSWYSLEWCHYHKMTQLYGIYEINLNPRSLFKSSLTPIYKLHMQHPNNLHTVFALFCYGLILTDLPILFRVKSLALGQSEDCPSASEVTLKDMGK